jgi:hypothetical protein
MEAVKQHPWDPQEDEAMQDKNKFHIEQEEIAPVYIAPLEEPLLAPINQTVDESVD